MSSPQPNSYNAPTGRPVYAGRVAPGPQNYEHLIDEFAPAIPNLGVSVAMPDTIIDLGNQGGDRPEIGLYTEWQSRYLAIRNDPAVSQQEKDELRAYIIKQADDIKDYPWWDENALSAINVPPDMSHRPNIWFLPILLTNNTQQRADFLYAMRGMVYTHMRWRQRVSSDPTTPNVLPQYPLQQREWAWLMREFAQLAYLEEKGILTDSYLDGTEFRTSMANHLSHMQDQMARTDMSKVPLLGTQIWRDMYGRNQYHLMVWSIAHWHQGFCGSVVGHILKLGFTDWLPVANWHLGLFEAISGGKWPLRDADGNYSYFGPLMDNIWDNLTEQEKENYDIIGSIPFYDMPDVGRRWYEEQANAISTFETGNGWPQNTIVDSHINGVRMTYPDRWDNRLSALGMYAEAGVSGASILLNTLKEQRQIRIDRGGMSDNQQYKFSLGWRVPTVIPQWRQDQASATWVSVASNQLSDIDPEDDPAINPNYPGDAPWRALGGQGRVTGSWNGMVYVPETGELRSVASGGHDDYGGNEDYALPVLDASPTWVMKRPPSGGITAEYPNGFATDDGLESTGVYADGLPRSVHNYNATIYDPLLKQIVLVMQPAIYRTASHYRINHRPAFFELDGTFVGFGADTGLSTNGKSAGGGACYDPNRDCYWWKDASDFKKMLKYDKATNSWSRGDTDIPVGPSVNYNFKYCALTMMADIDRIFITCGSIVDPSVQDRAWLYSPADDNVIEITLQGKGVGCSLSGDMQPAYDPETKRIYYWNNSTDTAVINQIQVPEVLTDPWVISQLPVNPANAVTPTDKAYQGTYGKFQFVPELNGFLLVNSTVEDTFFYARPEDSESFNVQPVASGGTVETAITDFAGTGWQLLSTAPTDESIYHHSGHAGAVWDETRQLQWIFGAETHNSAAGMDNALYRYNLETGLFETMYQTDPWPGEYRVDADGYLWADAAKTHPWATHTFNRMVWFEASKEIALAYDTEHHSYWSNPTLEDPAVTLSGRKAPLLFYNTVTGEWRTEHSTAIESFVTSAMINGMCYVPGYGYYSFDDTRFRRLDEQGNYSLGVVGAGTLNTQYHDKLHYHNGYLYKFGGGKSGSAHLVSKHNIDDIPGDSTRFSITDFSVLDGWSTHNKPSCMMPDGNILFLAHRNASAPYDIGAFIYHTATDTVTFTGHMLTAGASVSYDWKLDWSVKYNCAIYNSASMGTPRKVYGLRI